MNNYQKYALTVVALVSTATISFRVGQEYSKDGCKKALEKRDSTWQVVVDADHRLYEGLKKDAQDEFVQGVALTEDCHLKDSEEACAYLRHKVAEWRSQQGR